MRRVLLVVAGLAAVGAGCDGGDALARRQAVIKEIDEKGIIATPANSYINELVVEAARASILANGAMVRIIYGEAPHIEKV